MIPPPYRWSPSLIGTVPSAVFVNKLVQKVINCTPDCRERFSESKRVWGRARVWDGETEERLRVRERKTEERARVREREPQARDRVPGERDFFSRFWARPKVDRAGEEQLPRHHGAC